ncbi:MAG: oligosaccharide flippase family protein [Candidatus Nanoarchaeia archaeon]|nr:oligosaccharide flippase family protein [Candidatus Nanoarchaeia archaeon]MDD5741446.1 oligosaccharide flippase family protein [Candidatus Nanoarchaeia archaeon]
MGKKEIKQKLINNSIWGFVASMINRVGALVFTIILARFLMPENYGIYSLVLSIAMIFATFNDIGISRTFIRYLSFSIKKNKKEASAYHFYLLRVKIILTLFLSVSLLISAYPLSFFVFKNSSLFAPLIVAGLYVLILTFEGFYSSVFYSVNRVDFISFKESLLQILRITLVIFVVFFINKAYQISGIFFAMAIASFLLLIFNLYYIKKLMPSIFKKTDVEINKRKVNRFIGFLTIANISGIFFSYIDSIMLGIFLPNHIEFVGYYRVAFSLIIGIAGILSFLNSILLSFFSKMNIKRSSIILNKAIKYLSIISIPSIFGLIILRDFFIRFFFGVEYSYSSFSLLLLSPLIFFIVAIGLFSSLFSAEEKPQIFAKLILITTLINIVLNFILIKSFLLISPHWAIAGAAIATTISWIFYFFSSVYYMKREFKISLLFGNVFKPILASAVMGIVLYILLSFINNLNFLTAIFIISGSAVVYLITLFLIGGINKSDIELLYSFFYPSRRLI